VHKPFIILTLLTLFALLQACTWVKTTPGGENVRVAKAEQVTSCERKGEVTASLKSRVGGYERKPGKVAGELETLARNDAATMGGNTVVGETTVKDGTKTFGVYNCNP